MKARIFQPARNAMQSGTGNSKHWVLQYIPRAPKIIDPLMGWVGSEDTRNQIRMTFPSLDAAVEYAEREGLEYTVSQPKKREYRLRGYGDNFSYYRKVPWSH